MGLMATSAAPGVLETLGRAPVPPGAASIGVITLLLHLKGRNRIVYVKEKCPETLCGQPV